MKKLVFLFIISAFLGNKMLFAKKVDITEAQKLATNFFYEQLNKTKPTDFKSIQLTDAYTEFENGVATFYAFNLKDGGFIFFAADDVAFPVLGYSYTGKYDLKNASPAFISWMQGYENEIIDAINAKTPQDVEVAAKWAQLRSITKNNYNSDKTKDVTPLVVSMWNQDSPYNMFCPVASGGPGGRVYAGCVATAMSQIMHYYKYPIKGTGSKTYTHPTYGSLTANFGVTYYDWYSMLDEATTQSATEVKESIALLMYHCGVAVEMNYGPDGSGAFTEDVPSAVYNYFGYSNTTSMAYKSSYSQTNWENLLKAQLDAKKPMLYRGSGADGGHAFVCDGYQNTNYFHFNFGWSGISNGYYLTTAINTTNGTFNSSQGAIINMVPGTGYPYYCNTSGAIERKFFIFEDGSGPIQNYQQSANCAWLLAYQDESGVESFTINFRKLDTEANDDVITIYNGPSASNSVIGIYSGSTIPSAIIINNDSALITFTADGDANVGQGFEIYATANNFIHCTGSVDIIDQSGTINDGSMTYNYANNANCKWTIKPAGATSVTISFTEFNTQAGDLLKIYDVSGSTAVLKATYSGNAIPASVTTGPKMRLFFSSDANGTAPGWTANYTSVCTTYTVTFNVTDGTSPLDSALVEFNSQQKYTNSSGVAEFANVAGWAMPYTVSKNGYVSKTGTTDVSTQNVNLNIAMGGVGITKTTNKNSFAVYPNPASNRVNISGNFKGFVNPEVLVVNILGEIVLKQNLNQDTENAVTIDISNITKGIYFVKILDNKASKFVKKLIVE